jgi:hypothetical protein
MNQQKEVLSSYVTGLIQKSQMPRNQIAPFSGLSNTYIRDLEAGNYANVPREKLIFLAVALNLNLPETEDLLAVFDRRNLTAEDIPIFVSTAGRRRKTAALLPLRDGFPLDLALLSAEMEAGPHIVVAPTPTYCLISEGHRRHMERKNVTSHPIHGELVEAISRARARNFIKNLEDHPVHQYLCRECLEDYVRECEDKIEKSFRPRHIENLAIALEQQPHLHLYLTSSCPSTSFALKLTSEDGSGKGAQASDKLIIVFWQQHMGSGRRAGRLSGFTTDNPIFIQNFKDEVQNIKDTVLEQSLDRDWLVAFLKTLIRQEAG